MTIKRIAWTAMALSLGTTLLVAQAPPRPTPIMTDNSAGKGPLDRLSFRSIGPATPSGRIDDFAVLESDPATFYVATATAGIYKTTNAGTTFTNVFDNEGSSSVGDVAIAPTDPNLVWAGTGENNNRQSSSWGDGVYKSTDGGRNWKNMGLRASKQIARIIVDPVDFNVVYVAALGDLWAAGGERGVYKTTDGGQTWNRTLFVDEDTGATELVIDPINNKTLYAATYQRRRQWGGMNGGGPGSTIWKSTDAGQTWSKIDAGLPAGPKGRIGMDIYRKNPNVLYARVEHDTESGVYRTDDGGANWRKLSTTNPRPMYFSQIRVDPQTDSRIYVLGVSLHISDDGGKTFRDDGAERVHVDHHAFWINPANPNHVMIGNDGGVSISYDRAANWVWLPNILAAQAYHVEFDMQTPYHVCAGLQDNNTWCGPSAVRTNSGIINDDWYVISGGDGFQPLMDPTDARIVYAESQDGRMSRTDRNTNERTTVRPEPAEQKPGDTSGTYRFNWDTAMQLSPFDPATIYIGANMVLKSLRPRPLVPADQPRPHHQHRPRHAADHGRARQGHQDCQARRRHHLGQHRHARGIGGESRRGVGGQRRRRRERDAGLGQDVDQRDGEDSERAEVDVRGGRAAVARGGGHGLRRVRWSSQRRLQHLRLRNHRLRWDVEIDRQQPPERAKWPAASRKIERTPTCSTSAPRPACGCRGTAAGSGRSSRPTCRRCRFTRSRATPATTI